jgi:hypothetical protein
MLVVCLAACAPVPVARPGYPRAAPGEEFTLSIGDARWLADSNELLIFDGVAEDSRCARNVACIWEGNARARFIVRDFSPLTRHALEVLDDGFELNTSSRFLQRRETSAGTVVLRGLDPQPPIDDPMRYAARLLIGPKE